MIAYKQLKISAALNHPVWANFTSSHVICMNFACKFFMRSMVALSVLFFVKSYIFAATWSWHGQTGIDPRGSASAVNNGRVTGDCAAWSHQCNCGHTSGVGGHSGLVIGQKVQIKKSNTKKSEAPQSNEKSENGLKWNVKKTNMHNVKMRERQRR